MGTGGCVGRRVAVAVAGGAVGVDVGVDVGKTTKVLVGVGCGVSVAGTNVEVAVDVGVGDGIAVGDCGTFATTESGVGVKKDWYSTAPKKAKTLQATTDKIVMTKT